MSSCYSLDVEDLKKLIKARSEIIVVTLKAGTHFNKCQREINRWVHIASSNGHFCGLKRTRSEASGRHLNCSWLSLARTVWDVKNAPHTACSWHLRRFGYHRKPSSSCLSVHIAECPLTNAPVSACQRKMQVSHYLIIFTNFYSVFCELLFYFLSSLNF